MAPKKPDEKPNKTSSPLALLVKSKVEKNVKSKVDMKPLSEAVKDAENSPKKRMPHGQIPTGMVPKPNRQKSQNKSTMRSNAQRATWVGDLKVIKNAEQRDSTVNSTKHC
jgi:hypothetical protein